MSEPHNLLVALALARQGLAVFPVQAGGASVKQPFRFFPWKDKSTSDEATLRAYWRQYPSAMPALDVGKSGLLVVDADRHDAENDGVETWGAVMASHGFDPSGMPIVATPNEGCHFIFRQDGRFGNTKGSLPKGIDVRGAGGYIVAPGAVLDDGRSYDLDGDLSAAPDVPCWLAELVAKRSAPVPASATTSNMEAVRTSAPADAGLDEIGALLAHIPADCGYDEWVQALMAVHAATGGSSAGEALADQWSAQGAKYKPGEVPRKWRSFKSGGVNGATLAALAAQYGADLSAIRIAHLPPLVQDEDAIRIGRDAFARMARKTALIEHEDGTVTDRDGVLVEPAATKPKPATALDFPPGLVGDIAHWICDTARRPQPALALGAALALVGTVAGRQFMGPTESATHLYVLGLAPTGQGKDHALQQIARIMSAAQLGQHLGPSEFISMPAVSNFVTRCPLSICPMDEFGDFLARILNKRASSFERSVAKLMRSFWGISFGVYQSPEWAGRTAQTIHCPAMTIYGASTPEQFWRALEGGAVEDGTLNRFLVLGGREVSDRDPLASAHEVPGCIIDGLRWIWERSGPHMTMTRNQSDNHEITGKALRMGWADAEAERVYRDLLQRNEARLKNIDEAPFYARTTEMAVRIATIAAIGRLAPEVVSADDMEFGARVSEASSAMMLDGARDYLADSEHQAAAQRVRRIIKSRDGKIQRKALLKALQHSMKARDLNDILAMMKEAGEIEEKEVEPARGGTLVRWYFLSD